MVNMKDLVWQVWKERKNCERQGGGEGIGVGHIEIWGKDGRLGVRRERRDMGYRGWRTGSIGKWRMAGSWERSKMEDGERGQR